MSRISGTFSRCSRSPVSTEAAIILSAAFFAPETRTLPLSGRPPVMWNASLASAVGRYSQEKGFGEGVLLMRGFSSVAGAASIYAACDARALGARGRA